MFVKLFVCVVCCFIVVVRTEDDCDRWKNHRNFHLIHTEDECGKMKIDQETSSRILNGRDAARGSLPWMALIKTFSDDGHGLQCGGSVINNDYVLTAAHCFKLNNPTTTVYLGVHNKSELKEDGVEKYNVTKLIINPRFEQISLKYDVALLRLDRSINTTSPYINYICLPPSCVLAKKTFRREALLTAGWGKTANGQNASTLQKVTLKGKKCNNYTTQGKLFSPDWSQVCAGSDDSMAFGGDSGGPLLYQPEADGRFVQVGVSSLAQSDCKIIAGHKPINYFTRVTPLLQWILTNIDP